jgi:hypothetical protein
MGTKAVYKVLWFQQSGVMDKVQKSAKERQNSGLLGCDAVAGSVSRNF